jgi:hypothetical protein
MPTKNKEIDRPSNDLILEPMADRSHDEDTTLSLNLVLVQTERCTVRCQENQYLVYNQDTDELHLLPDAAYSVYAMCDGSRSFGRILSAVSNASEESLHRVHAPLEIFLCSLIERGLIKKDKYHDV